MVSIVSGSLIDVIVLSFVLSLGADRKGISRLSCCISGPLWIGLFIYLFLRKVLPGVAKRFRNTADHGDTSAQMEPGAQRFSENSRRRMWPKAQSKPEMFARTSAAQDFEVRAPSDALGLALSQFVAVNCYTPRTCDTACRFGQFALLPNRPACGTRPERVVHSNSIL